MSNLIGDALGVGGVGNAAQALLDDIGKLIPDTNLRAKLQAAVQARQQELQPQRVPQAFEPPKVQGELTRAEAGSESFFLRGWRPFLAWAMTATLLAILWTCLLLYAFDGREDFTAFNPFLQTVLAILLPLAGLRTLDKGLGVAPDGKAAPATAVDGLGDRRGE